VIFNSEDPCSIVGTVWQLSLILLISIPSAIWLKIFIQIRYIVLVAMQQNKSGSFS